MAIIEAPTIANSDEEKCGYEARRCNLLCMTEAQVDYSDCCHCDKLNSGCSPKSLKPKESLI